MTNYEDCFNKEKSYSSKIAVFNSSLVNSPTAILRPLMSLQSKGFSYSYDPF